MQSSTIFPVVRKNVPYSLRRDFYHDLLMLGWGKTLFIFIVIITLIHAIFATLYWIDPLALTNSDGSWWNAFFFSVQTLATIGYGYWSPATTYAHTIVMLEAGVGFILIAIMTGFFFAKFARANAKIEFSRNILITNFDGKLTLLFRVINIRNNRLIDSTIHVNLLKQDNSSEGHTMRRFIDLKLVRSRLPVLSMGIMLRHVIDEESPLQRTEISQDWEIIVTIVGTDGTFGQTVHATHIYRPSDLVQGRYFADMVEVRPDGTRIIDYAKFNELM